MEQVECEKARGAPDDGACNGRRSSRANERDAACRLGTIRATAGVYEMHNALPSSGASHPILLLVWSRILSSSFCFNFAFFAAGTSTRTGNVLAYLPASVLK